ncbi:hypothetical protein EV424DRAFT_1438787 [Suillus variegatus]|nr:hypothetical protein EV424DRAFT_1438787 [Suillus variegatus]
MLVLPVSLASSSLFSLQKSCILILILLEFRYSEVLFKFYWSCRCFVREYHAKLVAYSDAETSMNLIVFQERVHVSTSSTV